MSQIRLEVTVPGNAKTYEFRLDDRMKAGTARKQIQNQINEMEGYDVFEGTVDVVMCSVEQEGLIGDGESLHRVGIKNGDRLLIL